MTAAPVVLLVQSHTDSRDMYAEFLTQSGLSTVAVGDGEEALHITVNADVIVTDLLIPGMDGIELITRFRTNDRTQHTPIIVLTACAFPADRVRAEGAGCAVFLPLPCAPDELLHHVRRLLPTGGQGRAAKAAVPRQQAEGKRSA